MFKENVLLSRFYQNYGFETSPYDAYLNAGGERVLRGYPGPQGPLGHQGPKGDRGRDGLVGTDGGEGAPGHVFMIPVRGERNIYHSLNITYVLQ